MAVTRSSAADRANRTAGSSSVGAAWRTPELLWLLIAGVLVSSAWWLVYSAKLRRVATVSSATPPLNVSQLERREQLLPVLQVFANANDRDFAARKIFDVVAESGGIANAGALARIRIPREDLVENRKLVELQRRGKEAKGPTVSLLTQAEFALVKSQITVRTLTVFRRQFLLWTGTILFTFLLIHVVWSLRGFRGPWVFLPSLLLLTGLGLAMMVSLRDPLRDTLIFVPFAQGVAIGGLVMLAASLVDWERATANYSFVPLLGAIVLSIALIVFGSGPTGSDARVNLGPFQPVEIIKILLVFFLAGYFAKRWPLLRELREKRSVIARALPFLDIPRFEYAVPVFVGVGVALVFFYLQKDLGPALVFACVFLTLYSIARKRVSFALMGLVGLFGGFSAGYFFGHPKTVHDRVSMWLSPWTNTVRGGDQVVHSLWAFASGGALGTGPGLGEPDVIPAGYTDLIVSVLAEEWGFLGFLSVYLLFALLIWMSLRIALRARTDYAFFLATGLGLLVTGELLLISAGILDLFPLSGVATPFLSYGRTAMIANFCIVGILLALAKERGDPRRTYEFHSGLKWVQLSLALIGLIVVGKAAYVQLAQADPIAGAGTLVLQADGGRRYVYNPRLMDAARSIERGAIYDRTGLPLATSDWNELERHRADYKALGIEIDTACNRAESRHYPLGSVTFHLLGDVRTRASWSAPNSSLVERDSAVRLQGYDDHARIVELKENDKSFYTVKYDYRELLPLLRHRWEPDNIAVKRIRDRERNVHLTIHAGLQTAAAQILSKSLASQHLDKGSVVVLDPATGDLLASVNLPAPEFQQQRLALGDSAGSLLDRARYGLYPPGSTFKIVTAIAALRADPKLADQKYQCIRLPDGRSGNFVNNSKRPVRDDVQDHAAHGTLDLNRAIVVSCNAYFAQLGTYNVGAEQMLDTAKLIGVGVSNPADVKHLKPQMPQVSYGQGQAIASPFQMARVAAAIAADGALPQGRWVMDDSNLRTDAAKPLLAPAMAKLIGRDMRGVVMTGTGRRLAAIVPPIAGKTGTAELAAAPSHGWFIGFAPYSAAPQKIAFSVLVENGRYGGTAAAPIAGDLVIAAQKLKLIP